jgi:hypothetical protein
VRALLSHITFPSFEIRFVSEVEIESAWDKLTTTCKLTLPRSITFKDCDDKVVGANGAIKRGDKVTVALAYDTLGKAHYKKTFYVAKVKNNIPVEIELEDEMFLLKKGSVSASIKGAKLSTVLGKLGLTNSFKGLDIDIGDFRFDRLSPAAVLDKLRKDYQIKSYYRDGKFYAGLAFYPNIQRDVTVEMREDVVDNSLDYLNKEERYVHVTATSILKVLTKTKKGTKNKTIKVAVGDFDGEERTMHFYNIKSEEALKAIANQELDKFKYSGYSGTLTTFGYPLISFGDKLKIVDKLYKDRSGIYLVKSVKMKFGVNGFRQEIEIEGKIA